jgi:DNA-binding protein H-NS
VAKLNLKSMSAFELIDLRSKVEAALSAKVGKERAALETRLDTLSRFGGKRGAGRPRHALAGKKIAPKYRGPEGETWSGRGLKPRWLAEALKQGKKVEDFLISTTGRGKKSGAAKA